MSDSHARLIRYLQDAHAAEWGIGEMLKGFIENTSEPHLRTLFENKLSGTRAQEDSLKARLTELGATPSAGKSFLNELMGKVGQWVANVQDEEDRNVQNVVRAYGTAQLQCALYEAIASYAAVLNDFQTETLARRCQFQEQTTIGILWPLISAYARSPIEPVDHVDDPDHRVYTV